jgi:acetamidase/formamidase/catechol 2,3-dioxygenase-like lactoylglutathione lyase family enzyme
MTFDITASVGPHRASHRLAATPDSCFWGYIDRAEPAILTVDPGDLIEIEAITHHAGDAPDLLMDDGIRAIWDAIPEATRGPGVHILTGPIHVRGAKPGDTLVVRILDMWPRLGHGSNCAANWGLLYDRFGKERITIYELDNTDDSGSFPAIARPRFGFDFTAQPLYGPPGVISPPDPAARQPFGTPVAVPVRPHFGVMGVAPATDERLSSIPPGVFGGNVDNWRFGPGATICYPVFTEGANLFVGDPHFAQGDGEIYCHRGVAERPHPGGCTARPGGDRPAARDRHALGDTRLLHRSRRSDAHGRRADAVATHRSSRYVGRRRLLAGLGGGRPRRHPGGRRHARLSRIHRPGRPGLSGDARTTPRHGRFTAPPSNGYGLSISPQPPIESMGDADRERVSSMAITGMNHAVLYVRDARTTQRFYSDVLEFSTVIEHEGGAYVFMRAPASENHHDIAFFTIGSQVGPSEAGRRTVGMYHLAWEVPTLDDLEAMRARLVTAGALVGASDHGVNKSLYAVDPDGLEFEVMWLVPPQHWGDLEHQAIIEPLDIAADRRHFATLGLH